MMKVHATLTSVTNLTVWQETHKLARAVYQITRSFPKEETCALTDQIRRASASITSIIAEGFGRRGHKDRVRYYYSAQGSLTELKNQLVTARAVEYLTNALLFKFADQAHRTHRLLYGFIAKSRMFIPQYS